MNTNIFSLLIFTLIVSIRVYSQLNSTNINDHNPPGCYDTPPFNHSHNYPNCTGRWVKLNNIDIANYSCPNTTPIKVLEDNFDGTTLDFNTWKIGYPYGGEINNNGTKSFGGMPYSNNNLYVNNGYLYLQPKVQSVPQGLLGVDYNNNPVPSKNFDYTEPAISSWMQWGYGIFEIKCKMADNPVNLNSAFWIYGGCQNEVDVFETFDDVNEGGIFDNNANHKHVNMRLSTSVYSAVGDCGGGHRFTRDNKTKVPYGQTLNQWHTYRMHWDQYSVQLEVDGVNMNKFFTSMFKVYPGPSARLCAELQDNHDYRKFSTYPYATDYLMYLILDVNVRGFGNDEGALPTALNNDRLMLVDYIKVWQNETCGQTKNLCGTFNNNTMRATEFGSQVNISPNNCGWLLQGNSGSLSRFTAIGENEVALLPGFNAENQTVFSAYIQPCNYSQRVSQAPIYDSILDSDIDEYHLNTLNIQPNPNKGSFTVNLPENEKGVLKVYNSLAVMVYEQNIDSDKREISVDLSTITSGFYYITIETGTKTYTSKFIVEK